MRNILFEAFAVETTNINNYFQGYLSINDNKNINNDLVNAIINNDINIYAVYGDDSESELSITKKEVDTESALKSFNYEFDGGYIRTDNITNVAFSISSELTPVKFVFYTSDKEEHTMMKSGRLRSGNSSSSIETVLIEGTAYDVVYVPTDAQYDCNVTNNWSSVIQELYDTYGRNPLPNTYKFYVGDQVWSGEALLLSFFPESTIYMLSFDDNNISSDNTIMISEWSATIANDDVVKLTVERTAEISKVKLSNTTYNIKDTTAREGLLTKQDTLVSGTNIKTINNNSIIGSGNIDTDKVFIATKNITTYSQLVQAVVDNKVIVIDDYGSAYAPAMVNLYYADPEYFTLTFYTDLNMRITYKVIDGKQQWVLSQVDLQPKLVSGTNIKTVNNQSLLGSGNIDIQVGDNYIAGDGIAFTDSSEGVVISNTAGIYTGDDISSTPVPLNADQLEGYTVNNLIKFMFPIGSILQNNNGVNPSTYITGTTWQLVSSVALASENVFGNTYGLAITNNTNNAVLGRNTSYSGTFHPTNSFGSSVGASATTVGSTSYGVYGVPTKTQLSDHPEYSGLIADTITVYTWERTA